MKEEREELIEKIRGMRDKGAKISEISRATGLSRPTVRHYLKLSLDSDSDSDKGDRFLEKPKTLIGSIRRAIPVPDPSSDLKIQREETEKTFLEVERARALKSLERLTQEVPEEIKRKENELEIKKIDLERIKVERELKALQTEELKKEQQDRRREQIEVLKEKILPIPLRNELPPYLRLTSLIHLTEKLNEIDFSSCSENELIDYGRMVLWRELAPYRTQVALATLKGIFMCLEEYLKEVHKKYLPQVSFNEFMEYIFSRMLTEDPKGAAELLLEMHEFAQAIGSQTLLSKVNSTINFFLSTLNKITKEEKGGEKNGAGLPF